MGRSIRPMQAECKYKGLQKHTEKYVLEATAQKIGKLTMMGSGKRWANGQLRREYGIRAVAISFTENISKMSQWPGRTKKELSMNQTFELNPSGNLARSRN